MKRPYPPTEIPDFLPAPEVFEFVQKSFFNLNSSLFNPDHDHLHHIVWPDGTVESSLAFLWASSGFERGQRYILGECESVSFNTGGWRRIRQESQMENWFGHVPDFLITLDAGYCRDCSDVEFCALVEHELYHIAQKLNGFGEPMFYADSGLPKLCIRGHDVEEFHGIVRRYGASEEVKKMVGLANAGPELSNVSIAHACGTCQLRIA